MQQRSNIPQSQDNRQNDGSQNIIALKQIALVKLWKQGHCVIVIEEDLESKILKIYIREIII